MASDNEHWQIYCNARTPKGAVNWRAMGQANKRFARFKEQHPSCCFCGGKRRPKSINARRQRRGSSKLNLQQVFMH